MVHAHSSMMRPRAAMSACWQRSHAPACCRAPHAAMHAWAYTCACFPCRAMGVQHACVRPHADLHCTSRSAARHMSAGGCGLAKAQLPAPHSLHLLSLGARAAGPLRHAPCPMRACLPFKTSERLNVSSNVMPWPRKFEKRDSLEVLLFGLVKWKNVCITGEAPFKIVKLTVGARPVAGANNSSNGNISAWTGASQGGQPTITHTCAGDGNHQVQQPISACPLS